MRPKKNLTMLVDAFQQLLEHLPQAQLVIAGDGPECARLKAYIDDLGLWANIRLLGLRADVPELMSAFDVLALSSTTEAAPMVILEAGACQRPVVATAVGDIPEMIVHGETGYLIPSGDTAGLANYLLELLLHPEQRQTMGHAARVHVEAHFSIEASVRAREALFLQLLREKGLCPE
jgi:glycosyltransferase involved in cell wall biosynthesis